MKRSMLAVPPITEPEEIVRLNWAPEIAEGRPEIIASHVSGRDEAGNPVPGGFFDLDQAQPGDTFTLDREYVVQEVMTVDKDDFPTGKVYDPREGDWAVLITCGGALNEAERSYEDNVLVFAEAI